MASSKPKPRPILAHKADVHLAGLAKVAKEEDDSEEKTETDLPLPQTLVRIPTQHAPSVLPQGNADE